MIFVLAWKWFFFSFVFLSLMLVDFVGIPFNDWKRGHQVMLFDTERESMRWRPCSSMMIAISISFSTRSECIYSMEMLEQLNVEFSISLLLLLDFYLITTAPVLAKDTVCYTLT